MKKLILILAILVVASPAFAALDVNIVKLAGNQVQVYYKGADTDNLPRGFALAFEVSSTADVCGISAYKTDGESTAASPGYGIYPATIAIDSAGTVTNWGTPLADQADPLPPGGDQVLPSKNFVLEFGSLYAPANESTNAPGADGNLCVLSFDPNNATPNFTIKMYSENVYRGGVVLEDGTTADVNTSITITTDVPCLTLNQVFSKTICDPCLTNNLTVTQVILNKWEYLSRPKCWCCNAQKCGNGIYTTTSKNRVDAFDLSALKTAFFKYYTQAGYNPCLDFNLSGRIDAVDLSILKLHFFKTTGSSGCL